MRTIGLLKYIPVAFGDEDEKETELEKAVGKAIEETKEGEGEEEEEKEGEETDDEGEDGDEENESDDNEEEEEKPKDDESQTLKDRLYEALQNPATAAATVRELAKVLKIDFAEGTPAEKKEAVKDLEEELKEILGKDYEFLGARIASAVKHAVKRQTGEEIAPLKQRQEAAEAEAAKAQIQDACVRVDTEFVITDKIQKKAFELIKESPKPPSMSYHTYIRGKMFEAASELNVTLSKKASSTKDAQRQRNFERTQGNGSSGGQSGKKTSAAKSLDEAITTAVAQVKAGKGKK